MTYRPNSEQVAVAWLKGVTALIDGVATSLPADDQWPEIITGSRGFVQVHVVGGTPNMYLPVAMPVVSVDCWAARASSGRPSWNMAHYLAEMIRLSCLDHALVGRVLNLPAEYSNAVVQDAHMVSEPRRIVDDPADYAHVQMDVQLSWIAVPA